MIFFKSKSKCSFPKKLTNSAIQTPCAIVNSPFTHYLLVNYHVDIMCEQDLKKNTSKSILSILHLCEVIILPVNIMMLCMNKAEDTFTRSGWMEITGLLRLISAAL